LHGVWRFPEVFCLKMIADAGGGLRMIEVKIPVDDVDPVDHQIGEDAAAKVPEPAPLPEAILVERLVFGRAEEPLPIDRFGVDVEVRPGEAGGVAIPGEVNFVNLAELAGFD